MKVVHWKDCEDKGIAQFPYRGEMREVVGTSVRWLSRFGDDGHGYPEYGLRLFTVQPDGQIPIHNHFYHQTMYILDGEFECWAFAAESDQLAEKKTCGPGSSIFVPSMEPHGMKNIGKEPAHFLCCICNVYEEDAG